VNTRYFPGLLVLLVFISVGLAFWGGVAPESDRATVLPTNVANQPLAFENHNDGINATVQQPGANLRSQNDGDNKPQLTNVREMTVPGTTEFGIAGSNIAASLFDSQESEPAMAAKVLNNTDSIVDSSSESGAYFPDTPLGRRLSGHMDVVDEVGPDAELLYQDSLQALRQQPEVAVELLSKAYTRVDENVYLDRWKMVDTLSSIETDYALDVLVKIASADIPQEQYPGEHGISSRSEEQMIRRAAVWGMERLANSGNLAATDHLQVLVKAADTNVREGAVLALLRTAINREEKKEQLKSVLAEQDHWMLSLSEHARITADAHVDVPLPNENDNPAIQQSENADKSPPYGVLP